MKAAQIMQDLIRSRQMPRDAARRIARQAADGMADRVGPHHAEHGRPASRGSESSGLAAPDCRLDAEEGTLTSFNVRSPISARGCLRVPLASSLRPAAYAPMPAPNFWQAAATAVPAVAGECLELFLLLLYAPRGVWVRAERNKFQGAHPKTQITKPKSQNADPKS